MSQGAVAMYCRDWLTMRSIMYKLALPCLPSWCALKLLQAPFNAAMQHMYSYLGMSHPETGIALDCRQNGMLRLGSTKLHPSSSA